MSVHTLEATNLGPIKRAQVRLGDLTVFVGPQATGKSILLQFLKLMLDAGPIVAEMKRQGLDWDKRRDRFLDVYLGEGMSGVWRPTESRLKLDGRSVNWKALMNGDREEDTEALFYVPAQRVLTLGRGWPRPFSDYGPGDPYVVRDFSENIRRLVESPRLAHRGSLFPKTHWLKPEFRRPLQETIFGGFGLHIDRSSPQKRLVLRASEGDGEPLPFMVWSAGQREFVPLLLGFFCLSQLMHAPRQESRWAVIEELEMGLHPRAISAVLLPVLELLGWDYRVCLSTHSPHVLDVVWALKIIQENHAGPEKLLKLFDIKATPGLKALAADILTKDARVYYFDPESHETKDISELDPGSEDVAMWGWGGLTESTGRIADVVADVVNASTR
jgi:hypothetical protein